MEDEINLDIYIPDEENMTTQEHSEYLEELMFESLEEPHEEETQVSINDINIKDFKNGK